MTQPGRPAGALVAVDLGTSSTCVAVGVAGEAPRVVLVDGAPLTSSAVYAEPAGLVVGAEADRRAALDPARYEPHPKRRVDEGTLLLGTAVVPVAAALAAVLARAVAEARATLGGRPVATLVLTHPADWGGVRTAVLRRAAAGLAERLLLLPEPVAAAVQHGRDLPAGAVLAVLDVGGGTTDVSVLRRGRDAAGFEVLATGGDPGFGGADLDEALLTAIGRRQVGPARERWEAVLAGRGLDDRRRARALRAEVRAAKESLSRHSFTDVALPAGLPDAHVSRDELEALAAPRVRDVVTLLARVLGRAGALDADGRSRAPVFLVGGSSRVPLVGREVHRVLGVVPVATDQPETVVVRGAVRHAAALVRPRTAPTPAPRGPVPGVGPAAGPPPPPPPAPPRRGRPLLLGAAAVVLLAATGAALALRGAAAPAPAPTRTVTVGDAAVAVPTSWGEAERTDAPGTATGDTAAVVLTPDGSRSAATRLLLQQTVLAEGADAAAVLDTLRTSVADANAAGGEQRYADLTGGVTYAGRSVTRYREQLSAASVVDWSVLVEGRSQISVGCQHDVADPGSVAGPCEAAVASASVVAGR